MQTGEKGKSYGLIKPNVGKANNVLKPSVFARDDDDDEDQDVNAQLREVSKKKQKQADAEAERLKKEDPTVYDYDGVYEKMQATKQQAVPVKQPEKKSKYIGALMEKAKIREREWAYDAKLQRERKNEDETYAGKEKFVTSAYKKKLLEDQMWKAEEARKAALEEDVTRKKDLGSFYKNLLDGNEAYGGIKESKPEEKKPKDEPKEQKEKGRDSEGKGREDRENERGDRDSKSKEREEDKDRENKKRNREEGEDRKENGKEKDKKVKGEVKEEEVKEESTKEETKEEGKEKTGKEKEKAKAPPQKLGEDAVSAAKLRYLQRKGLA